MTYNFKPYLKICQLSMDHFDIVDWQDSNPSQPMALHPYMPNDSTTFLE